MKKGWGSARAPTARFRYSRLNEAASRPYGIGIAFLVLGGRAAHEKGVWDGRRSGAEEVIGVLMDLERKRCRGSERVLRARRGTRRVLGLKALSLLGMLARIS